MKDITSTIIDSNKNTIYFSLVRMNNSIYCQVSGRATDRSKH